MTEYGVATRNKFAFLDEDASDPEEVLSKPKEAKKPDVKVPVSNKKTVTAEATVKPVAAQKEETQFFQKSKNYDDGDRNDGDRSQNNFRGVPRRPPRDGNDQNNVTGDRRPPRTFNKDRPQRQQPQSGDENAPPRERRGGGGDGYKGPPRGDRQPPRRQYNREDGEHNGEQRGPPRRDFQNREDGGNRRGPYENGGIRRGPHNEDGGNRRGPHNEDGGNRRGPYRDNRRPFRDGDDRRGKQENAPNTNGQSEEKNEFHQKAETEKATNDGDNFANDNVDTNGWEEKEENETNTNEEKTEEKTTEEQPPPEAKVIVKTLEEWKSEQKKSEKQFNLRKPGEGADQKVYQKLQPIKRETRDKDQDSDDDEHHYKEKREKALNIQIQFNDPKRNDREQRFNRDRGEGGGGGYEQRPNREGGQNDDRGGGGGGNRRPPMNRGQHRDGNQSTGYKGPRQSGGVRRQPEFNIESESFPALGAA